jgi:phosphatidylglycerophosphatase A
MTPRLFTSVFGLGFIKKAPGTFGSIPGLLLGHFLSYLPVWAALLVFCFMIYFSILAIRAVESKLNAHDPSEIVIDEVIGQAVAVFLLPQSWAALGLAFGFFRLFDILKPGIIGWVDQNVNGAFGTIADDLAAGFIAGCCVWVLIHFKF